MTQLLQNAAYGTALILAAAVLRRTLKDRLVPEVRLALWAVCLFRLLTPAAPESELSLWGLPRLFAPETRSVPALNGTGYIPAVGVPAPAPQPDPGISWETVLLAAWLIVGAVLAARYALAWTRTRRAVSCAIPLDQTDERYSSLPRCARLREGPMEGAPLTFGAMRPTVVLAPGLDGMELDCVLAHEGVHARRRDNLWHYAMALALVVHWWNPAVWLMSRLLRRDIELSCDRAAIRRLGMDRRADYARALVSLSTQAEGPAFCQTFGRKAAEERILSIMNFKKISVVGAIFSLTLVLALTAAFASEPKEPDEYGSVKTHTSVEMGFKTLKDIVSVPDIEATKNIQSDVPEVDPDDVDLSMLKEMLAKRVADGEITQEEADQQLAANEELLELARRGEVKLYMAEDGLSVYGAGVSRMYYKDEDGNLIPMDPGKTSPSYVLDPGTASNSYVLAPNDGYVEELADPANEADASEFLVGWGFVQYDVKLPTIDENGVPRVYDEDGNLIIVGTLSESAPAEPAPSAAPGGVTAQPLVNTAPSASCGVEGCTETRNHAHANGSVLLLSEPCPVEGCTITGNHIHGDVCYSCNGAGHDGGVCDGSCYTYNQPDMIQTSTHHSGSHHSSGHH